MVLIVFHQTNQPGGLLAGPPDCRWPAAAPAGSTAQIQASTSRMPVHAVGEHPGRDLVRDALPGHGGDVGREAALADPVQALANSIASTPAAYARARRGRARSGSGRRRCSAGRRQPPCPGRPATGSPRPRSRPAGCRRPGSRSTGGPVHLHPGDRARPERPARPRTARCRSSRWCSRRCSPRCRRRAGPDPSPGRVEHRREGRPSRP